MKRKWTVLAQFWGLGEIILMNSGHLTIVHTFQVIDLDRAGVASNLAKW